MQKGCVKKVLFISINSAPKITYLLYEDIISWQNVNTSTFSKSIIQNKLGHSYNTLQQHCVRGCSFQKLGPNPKRVPFLCKGPLFINLCPWSITYCKTYIETGRH